MIQKFDLNPPTSDIDPFELEESDVVWSSSASESSDVVSLSPTAPTATSSSSPTSLRPNFGLSAALSDATSSSSSPLIRRKSTLNPSLSASSAARLIPLVPTMRPDHHSGGSPARFPQSAPVNVPVWPKKGGATTTYLGSFDEAAEEDDVAAEDEEEMVPPHVMVARSHVMTFSVFEGVGRTLKGRDLRKVRNAVFQKTGFID